MCGCANVDVCMCAGVWMCRYMGECEDGGDDAGMWTCGSVEV